MYIYNKPSLKYRRKELRNSSTEAERILWQHLKNSQLNGFKFIRQYSIDNYVVDFYCPKARLAIELDGFHHAKKEVAGYDHVRTISIESYDITVLRFWNISIINNLENVLNIIQSSFYS